MCVLCQAFGQELDVLWHGTNGADYGSADAAVSLPARATYLALTVPSYDQDVDGLMTGRAWSGTVTYSFPDSVLDYGGGYGDGEPYNNFRHVTATQQAIVHKIMAQIEGFTNLDIDFAGTDSADIRIAESASANPTAYAYYPSDSEEGGDVWFGNNYDYGSPRLGDYYYMTHIHELGHSFGLKHGHDTRGLGPVPFEHDALEFTVMTYRSYVNGPTIGGYTNEDYGYPQTFMMNDIAALQFMYGADFGLNSTDSVYSFSVKTGEMSINGAGQGTPGANRIFLTVWDGGGTDTYKFNNYSTDLAIDLRPGSFSIASDVQRAYLGDGEYAQGNVYNAYLFENDARSYIENAIGGRGNDTLIGNAVDNVLNGNTGADTMIGGAGNDRYYVDSVGDLVDESNGSGADFVIASISFSLAGTQVRGVLDHLTLAGGGDIDGTGNGLANKLVGNDGANRIDGAGGNDLLVGGGGDDVFVFKSGMGHDTIRDFDMAGNDVIQFDDDLFANYAAVMAAASEVGGSTVIDVPGADNLLTLKGVALGSLGADDFRFVDTPDIMIGNAGDNLYVVSSLQDIVDESQGGGIDTIQTRFNFSLSPSSTVKGDIENLILTGKRTNIGYGNALDNVMTGSVGTNELHGGFGDDILNGMGGHDILEGGDGNDTLTGGDGADWFVFSYISDHDTVTDFHIGEGDLIYFHLPGFDDIADVLANSAMLGSDTVITYDASTTLTLQGVALGSLTVDDFYFFP